MHQARVGFHADVRFHPKVPMVALFARMHLRVALAILVFCGTGRGNERGVHRPRFFEHQALAAQQLVNSCQDALGQLVFFQPVAKPQDGALVRHTGELIEPGKLTVQRCVKKGFFHRRVRQAKPLLQEMRAQHCLQRKGWTAGAALGTIRRDKHH